MKVKPEQIDRSNLWQKEKDLFNYLLVNYKAVELKAAWNFFHGESVCRNLLDV